MFTGIISGVGRLKRIILYGDKRLEFITDYDTSDINIGASIACSGVCLTVTETSRDWFAGTRHHRENSEGPQNRLSGLQNLEAI